MATVPAFPKLSKAKARLMLNHPFFATLLMRTEIVVSDEVPTAATDGSHIYFNPDFLEQCSIEETMTVLAHEVGHDSLLHSLRLGLRNHDLWNQACDHAINLMLEDQGFRPPASGWLCDAKYKGWSADRIYDDLKRNPEQGSGGKPGSKPGGYLAGDVLPGKAKSDAEQAAALQKAKQRVATAANMARMAGKLRGELSRMIDDLLESKVPWTDLLRDYMLKVVRSRENWTRRNRHYRDIYLPRRWDRQMGPIVFCTDTSGSMWSGREASADLDKVCSEIAHCAAQTKPESIRVVWADTKVAGEQVFDAGEFELAKLKPQGGGGTDMRVVLKHAEQCDPQVVVLLTDGETPWPDAEPPYPLIVICTTNARCPVGQVIRV